VNSTNLHPILRRFESIAHYSHIFALDKDFGPIRHGLRVWRTDGVTDSWPLAVTMRARTAMTLGQIMESSNRPRTETVLHTVLLES